MVPAPSCPDKWDYWQAAPSDEVDLTCLLPNSVYVSMSIKWDDSLRKVKEELWDQATTLPLHGLLHESSSYVVQFINSLAVLEEVDDESKRIRDIKPVFGVLLIVERSIERPGEQALNTQISHLIGKGLNEFDSIKSSEVKDFRRRMRDLAEENMLKRAKSDPWERLRYRYKPRLADKDRTPTTLQSHLQSNNCFVLVTKFTHSDFTYSSSVPATRKPQEHIELVLRKFANSLKLLGDQSHNYVLKVCGREEYLFGDNPLIQFLYIQEMLSTDGVPEVMTVSIDKIPLSLNRDIPFYQTLPERGRLPSEHSSTLRLKKYETSWSIERDYSCHVGSAGRLNVDTRAAELCLNHNVVCRVGIFHGGKPLCETRKTRAVAVSDSGVAEWNEDLTFPIKVYNLPRMAKLCFGIYEITKAKGKKKGKDANKEVINKLAWGNIQIFDYKEQLRTDSTTLSMWTHVADDTQGDDLLLHPLGTVMSNSNTDSCTELLVCFSNYDTQCPIMFPKRDVVIAFSESVEQQSPVVVDRLSCDFEKLRANAEDPIYEMHEQEKKDIWAARELFLEEAPEMLPKLLSYVEWGERAEVASVLRMLPRWKLFSRVESALELLDYAYADPGVRSFAVKCLESISDDDLLLYLLQLVQALKHESYLMCDLAKFLITRAYNNMRIGHYLFWHLKSEMHVASVWIRFGLLLEAYCRGSQDHINGLLRQIACLEKLQWLCRNVRKKKEIAKARDALTTLLNETHCKEALCDFVSPLNPSLICKSVKPDSCRVMDSKMRPLLLDFENVDPTGKDIRIILKIGDDLRQDMFTLQMLRIMDRLWKSEGCDFRLNPYNCISVDLNVGLIEVVEDSQTIANIQKQSSRFNAASTINRAVLLQWLRKENNNETDALNKTIDEFTMSCAGYSVATYVLGIADRHPDNIMLKKTGQLFHIDFGHFLGHFKHKYGFRREWQPFVLTHEFIHVINKGQRGTGDNEPVDFKIFKEHCEKGFKILRKHGHLILSLFSMMISTGLPELSSEKDLQFLRDTLVMEQSEEKALEHFGRKFNESVKKVWTTSFQWTFHNIDKNN